MTKTEREVAIKEAEDMLKAWKKAEIDITKGEEYEIEGRSLKRVNMTHVISRQKFWTGEIKRLKNKKTGGAKIGQFIPMG